MWKVHPKIEHPVRSTKIAEDKKGHVALPLATNCFLLATPTATSESRATLELKLRIFLRSLAQITEQDGLVVFVLILGRQR